KLTQSARDIQLQHFLEQFLIRFADIPDIGPKRKATLAAYGIDSADDLSWAALSRVPKFGDALKSRLLAWRTLLERRFVFNPKEAVPQRDLDALDYRWRRAKDDLSQRLRVGSQEAARLNEAIRKSRASVAQQLEAPARRWAQACADLEAIESTLSLRRRTPIPR
ncbi:MAG: hypothetical protein JOZ54_22595, partial [Acidobacteria bacterium]|nr:hypothetical protein [Acidobacteriota bacterium]